MHPKLTFRLSRILRVLVFAALMLGMAPVAIAQSVTSLDEPSPSQLEPPAPVATSKVVSATTRAPIITVVRTPSTMTANEEFTLRWSTTNAVSVRRVCTASRTGFSHNGPMSTNGEQRGKASLQWAGFPSTCTWTATSSAGVKATVKESMLTTGAEEVTYIHTDAFGSPVARSNAAGVVISVTRYEPYGLTAAGDAPTIGFTGHVNDVDTGLVYMQQRYYDPVAGRFLSIDPVTTDANSGGSFNRYAFVSNSPYKYIDPDGRNQVLALRLTYRASYEVATLLGAGRLGSEIGIGLYNALHSDQAEGAGTENKPSLVDKKGERHILDGDETGGGHRPGTGGPNKSEFPKNWSDDKILGEISDVATSPDSTHSPGSGGRTISTGTRDGIDITTVTEPGSKGGRIVTGFPTNVPRNPPAIPKPPPVPPPIIP
jgi:RHS repeat-associated protein